MGKDKLRKGYKATGRDSGPFIALPWSVLDSDAYKRLSHPARSLLIEMAKQYSSCNNGSLLASRKFLYKRGWKSADVIQRAKKELIDGGFIYETVKGHRPNKASWYAITWQAIDKHPGFDSGAFEGFKHARSGYKNSSSINYLTPLNGTKERAIAPLYGSRELRTTPPEGTISIKLNTSVVPPDGNHLEVPSAVD